MREEPLCVVCVMAPLAPSFKTLPMWLLKCKHRSMFSTTQTLPGRVLRPHKLLFPEMTVCGPFPLI